MDLKNQGRSEGSSVPVSLQYTDSPCKYTARVFRRGHVSCFSVTVMTTYDRKIRYKIGPLVSRKGLD